MSSRAERKSEHVTAQEAFDMVFKPQLHNEMLSRACAESIDVLFHRMTLGA